jgi:hypothetical protein
LAEITTATGVGIAVLCGRLLDIADVEHGFRGQEPEHAEGALLLGLAFEQPRRLALAQERKRAIDEIELLLGFLVVTLGLLGEIVDALLETVEIGEHQFGLDGVDVGERRDLALDMSDVAVLEAAHHMGDGIDLADIGQKLVAEALAL